MPYEIGARVITTVDAPAAWEGALAIPAGSLGTIDSLPSRYGGYGVVMDDDPDKLPADYKENELASAEETLPSASDTDAVQEPAVGAGDVSPHDFKAEPMGEAEAKRRLPNCAVCQGPATAAAHDGDQAPYTLHLRALLTA
ncbi:hypothetical protein ACFU6S_32705 [Streptomyces sp. NPDC057456]|uniref:hypothetical protein n=1 Tax=Streptomyces sp. NPDC057456 TaxID=3346139 RepID=UPI0036ACE340